METRILKVLMSRIFEENFKVVDIPEIPPGAIEGKSSIVVSSDDTVRLVWFGNGYGDRYSENFPYKKAEVMEQISFDDLFRYIMSDSKEQAFLELRERLANSWEQNLGIVGERVKEKFVKTTCNTLQNRFETNICRIKELQSSKSLKKATEKIQEISDKTLRRFKGDLIEGAKDAIDNSISDFRANILQNIKNRFLEAKSSFDEIAQTTILPPGTKFFFSKGNRAMVVIEQEPQVRTVNFNETFLDRDLDVGFSRIKEKLRSGELKTSFRLAFPCTIFVLFFLQGAFDEMQLYYTTKPLSSNEDILYDPNLPNININRNICFHFSGGYQTNLTETTQRAIGDFWGSTFTGDGYWSNFYAPQRKRDRRFKNILKWEKQSIKNPLFVLQANWQNSGYTVKRLFEETFTEQVSDEDLLYDKLMRKAIEEQEEEVSEVIQDFLESIEVERQYSRVITRKMEEYFTEMAKNICDLLLGVSKEITDETNEKVIQQFNEVVASVINGILKGEFYQLSNEVSIQPRINAAELIRQIQRGR